MFVRGENIEHFRIGIEEEGIAEGGADREGDEISRFQGIDSECGGSFVDG